MKCVIPSQNVKIIARAIHSLSKIGDEMFIEPTENELIFRTVNMAQSAFAEFKMWTSYFSTYLFNENDNQALCKITMRSCLSVFKHTHNVEKQVESCEIRIKPDATVVIFLIKFTNSHMKKYYLPVIESEKLEATPPTDVPNSMIASSKFLSSAVKNFRHSEDEITVTVDKEKTLVKNHLELKKDQHFMRTELSFHPTEFESYTIGNPTCITFCFKELRAVLAFAEPSNLSVNIFFEGPGRPIVFKVANNLVYEANYIVSTLNASQTRNSRTSIDNINTRNSSVSRDTYRFIEDNSHNLEQIRQERSNNIEQIRQEKSNNIEQIRPERSNNIEQRQDFQPQKSPSVHTLSDQVHSEYDALVSEDFNINQSQRYDSQLSSETNELIKIVFKRCFVHKDILDDTQDFEVLAEDSDLEN